ncbi:MAG: radical SAM protein, partial [Thermoplasmata archaeon]|nr:radical SAM protein [Thermoplasmata archaeon]
VYCQVGRTTEMRVKRGTFYSVEEILAGTASKIKNAEEREEHIDYLTFVPDGEPTLDINLGKEIESLKNLDIRIAVISNSSLIWREDVRDDLAGVDWLSLKIDAVTEDPWRRINRPHGSLDLDNILTGISDLSDVFDGELATETMLVRDLNDDPDEVEKIAEFVSQLEPKKVYLSIPTRPPTEKWVRPPTESGLNVAYQIFTGKSIDAELLIGYEGNAFAFTGYIEEDLLSIASVHPMREEAVRELLEKADVGWDVVDGLLDRLELAEVEYKGKRFYVRRFHKTERRHAEG